MDEQPILQDPYAQREAEKYINPIPSREFILDYLAKKNSPVSYQELCNGLQIFEPEQQEALHRRLKAMLRDGQLTKTRRGLFTILNQLDLIPCKIQGHKDGHGFAIPQDGSPDIFLSARAMRSAFDGDFALVQVTHIDRRGKREGIIHNITERKHKQVVGKFFYEKGIGFVIPDNKRLTQNILIPADEQLEANSGQMVIAEIIAPPTNHSQPIGRIIEIMGDHMSPGMEIDVAIRSYGLPHAWPDAVTKEISKLKSTVAEKDKKSRIDLRHLPLVTIDGEDAKDFDDAVYCEKKRNGNWQLYVAIADVSHYVKPGTALDKEAYNRGNSVYFPGRVIPMLPAVLSNGLCSLNPRVDRLCMVCEMSISSDGKLTRYKFYSAVMNSHARLTYTEVARIIEDEDKEVAQKYQNLLPHIKNLHQLYKILHQYRQSLGTINFELTETRVVFGKNRKIEQIVPVFRNDAHKLIEECMLCANVAAAKFLLKHKKPALFRVHPGPKLDKLNDLLTFLSELGLGLGGGLSPTPADYAKLLNLLPNRPDAHLIQMVLLRSLSQAIYTPDNRGHFGLAFDSYTHFTSPIRRYPDLLVHRAIMEILAGKSPAKKANQDLEETHKQLHMMGEHCSMTERRADEATREALGWLKCEYMLDKVGETFDGVISGITPFGIFIELRDIFVEGLLHVTALNDDYYHFDAIRHRLVGEHSRKIYRIGDLIKIKVARVNLDQKQIDFILAESLQKISKTRKNKPNKKEKKLNKQISKKPAKIADKKTVKKNEKASQAKRKRKARKI